MTKKQALNYLRSSGFSKEQIKAVVDALQEPTTKNDLEVDKAKKDAELIARGDVINMIKELPSVTPIRPNGHWTEEFNDLEGEVRFTCSSCGKYQLFETDFCYHCGSDNREVIEE